MAYLKFYKRSCSKGESPTRKVRVNLADWPKEDRRKLLKSIALDWGEVNWQQTVFSNERMTAINFGCSGHGGILLFSLDKLDYKEELSSDQDYTSWPESLPKFYVYAFEEDCDWATFYLALPDNLKMKFLKQYSAEITIEKMNEYAEATKALYSPNTSLKLEI